MSLLIFKFLFRIVIVFNAVGVAVVAVAAVVVVGVVVGGVAVVVAT